MDSKRAERLVAAAMARDPDLYFKLHASAGDFEDVRYRRVYQAIHALLTQGRTPDLLMLHEQDGSLDVPFLSELTDEFAGAANFDQYDRTVVEHSRRRKLHALALQMQETAAKAESRKTIADIEDALVEITATSDKDRAWRIGELLPAYIAAKEELAKHPGEIPGLPTGIQELDGITQGLQKRRLIYIGARPSDGKSALMLNMAAHLALHEDRAVGVITLESPKEELLNRIYASTGRIDTWHLSSGSFTQGDLSRLVETSQRWYEKRLFIYDKPNADYADVLIQARRMHRVDHVEAVFVDYIGNVTYPDRSIPRHEQMAEVSKGFKALARELDIPIVVLSQLRRDAQNRRPTLADFAETSQIEKDADLAILIHHVQEEQATKSYLLIDKNRDGPKGSINVVFHKQYVDFRPAEATRPWLPGVQKKTEQGKTEQGI